jgi:hypothetical protein
MADIIRDLELSVRATNVLTAYGRVKTVEDFLALDRATVMGLPKSGTRTWEEIERVQLYLLREDGREVRAVFAPSDLPTRMFNETRRHMQRVEFYQGRQATALETLAQEQVMAEPATSLRDAAALAALQGLISTGEWTHYPPSQLTARAFDIADAFIAAREGAE